jgi:hypothetical protein
MSLTFDADFLSDLYRGLEIRIKRMFWLRLLHKHNGRAVFWTLAILALLVI